MKKFITILLLAMSLGIFSCASKKQLTIYQNQNDKLCKELIELRKYSARLETVILEAQDSNIMLEIMLEKCKKELKPNN